MPKCKKCNGRISLLNSFNNNGLCDTCTTASILEKNELDTVNLEKRKPIMDRLKKMQSSERTSLILSVPVRISTGGKAYAKKALFGMLTGGIAAVTEDRFIMDAVVFPDSCCLCGLLPRTHEMMIEYHFRRGSEMASLTGINLGALMNMNYPVCEWCAQEGLEAIQITDFKKSGEEWYLSLSILNPAIAQKIGESNKLVDSIPANK